MFNLIRSIRSFIPKRAEKKEDTGFTCSVYDMKEGKTVLDTHDIDEFLKFLEELDKREPEDTNLEEENGPYDCEDCCCDDCDCDHCDTCHNCYAGKDKDEDDTRLNELCVDRPDIHVVQIPVKGVIAAGYLICSIALLIATVNRK